MRKRKEELKPYDIKEVKEIVNVVNRGMWVVCLESCSESLETYVFSWIDRSKDDIKHLLRSVIEERELRSQDCFFRAGMSLVDVHELRQTNALFYVRRTNRRGKYICSSVNTTGADIALK